MPRIDPNQLLQTLGVLLAPSGGIKSTDEVTRIVTLMHKFSRTLVSKCIYVQILKATTPNLLERFLGEQGWELVNVWFSDAVKNQNWAFCYEMIELFALCPISSNRLKDNVENNHAPRLINQLRAEETAPVTVKELASDVYNKWVNVVSPTKDTPNAPLKVTLKIKADDKSSEEDTSHESNGLSVLQSMTEEVSQNIKKETKPAPKDSIKKPTSESLKRQRSKDVLHHNHHHSNKHKSDSHRSSSKDKDGSSKRSSKEKDREHDRKKRREDREKHRDRENVDKDKERERRKFRPDHRDEVDPSEKRRIKEIARRLKEEEQAKKDKDTLNKVGFGGAPSMAKIPKIPKKTSEDKKKSGLSFEDMLGGLDSKPKTVKTPLNKNKTAALLEGLTKASTSPSQTKSKDSSNSSKHHHSPSSSSLKRDHTSAIANGSSHKDAKDSRRDSLSRKDSHTSVLSSKRASLDGIGDLKKPPSLVIPEKKRPSDNDSPKTKSSSPHNVLDSSGFMDAIFSSIHKDEPRKKKRRLSDVLAEKKKAEKTTLENDSEEKGKSSPIENDTKEESNEDSAPPPVFSFYRDTLEETNDEATEEKKPASVKPKVMDDSDDNDPSQEEEKEEAQEDSLPNEKGNRKSVSPKDQQVSEDEMPLNEPEVMPRDVRGILIYHRGRDRQKKRITWKPESNLVAVKFFELDEDERVNVNKIKFENMRSMELQMEKAAITSKGSIDEEILIPWYNPVKFNAPKSETNPDFVHGASSKEREIQAKREGNVLQALYFSREMTPTTPAEPDSENFPKDAPIQIPLDDVEGGDESVTSFVELGWPAPHINEVDRTANFETSLPLPPALSNLLNKVGNLHNLIPPLQQAAKLSDEDKGTLVAQTQAMIALGMIPNETTEQTQPDESPLPLNEPHLDHLGPMPPMGPGGPAPVPPPNGYRGDPGFGYGPNDYPPQMGGPPMGGPPMGGPPMGGPPMGGPPINGYGPPPYGGPGGPMPPFGGPPLRGPPPHGFRGRGRGFPPRGSFRGNFRDDRRLGHLPENDYKIKTKPCVFFKTGHCRDGDNCRFIH
ncbi:hypothetical protein TCAL_02340 [Tigriopus californicus]|uniref:C3H1-type domain-containing protein n=1 Tax=Tigriopus californicus TaxID=6832 RepID=A0A553NYP9_TIGCA|nr:serine/threonine-protein phosphatase 1 regulatory subunit 10-like [Tigriopus californicus]TRY70559.1 hypothetical protein TCAL_02340 [Tigriopus californicus]|eukprot:TCALIF_02340-PA protein Name:"Similar to ppp1r10 Serine/threonine-protein phosphatase 1 regulatory subunit 10 (Xenopus laevis)" AED:0.00 eAED:0.00 QI:167/1/1/1/0.5/0.33/3/188/1057